METYKVEGEFVEKTAVTIEVEVENEEDAINKVMLTQYEQILIL